MHVRPMPEHTPTRPLGQSPSPCPPTTTPASPRDRHAHCLSSHPADSKLGHSTRPRDDVQGFRSGLCWLSQEQVSCHEYSVPRAPSIANRPCPKPPRLPLTALERALRYHEHIRSLDELLHFASTRALGLCTRACA